MMQTEVESGNQQAGTDAHRASASGVYPHRWWQSYGNACINSLTGTGERGLRPTPESLNPVTVGALSASNAINVNKEIPSGIALPSDGYNGQENQTLLPTPETMSENPSEGSQRELVGHSTVMTSYAYRDPCYGPIIPPFGQQPLVHPHLYGVHLARMPLRLEMEEEPVYVNAKQYNRTMRRRQIRAKAELEKKIIKNRKPYLHESRHQHAMRRARGCGGRFLNTKKLNSETSNSTQDNGAMPNPNQSTLPSVSRNFPNSHSGYLYPITEPQTSPKGTSTAHNFVAFGNNERNNVHMRSSPYHHQPQPGDTQPYSSQLREERMQMTSPSQRALSIT